MTKDELKIGYGVELRDGSKGILVPSKEKPMSICFFDGEWMNIEYIRNDLTNSLFNDCDIIKVYNFSDFCYDSMNEDFDNFRELLWQESDNKPIVDTAEDMLMYGMEILSED